MIIFFEKYVSGTAIAITTVEYARCGIRLIKSKN